ncbi:MAG: hypothetical protein IKC74_05075, partial [Clostridia bacterium]|nr:hypothetical protein [Clostridia bacterium]
MKKLLSILLAVLVLVSIFASCGGNDETTTTETSPVEPNLSSEGLAFEMNSDGKSYAVVGI